MTIKSDAPRETTRGSDVTWISRCPESGEITGCPIPPDTGPMTTRHMLEKMSKSQYPAQANLVLMDDVVFVDPPVPNTDGA